MYGYRLRNVDLDRVLETYAEQTLQNSVTMVTELAIGVGVLPQLELSIFGGQGLSSYTTSLWWVEFGWFISFS